MYQEHLNFAGPMRIRMDHLPEEKIRDIESILFTTERPVCERFYKGRGIDFRSGEIELRPTEVYLCGGHGLTGVRVNENAETNVPGLYAAGDTSLVARGHLSGAFVFGEIAAENATEFAASLRDTVLNHNQVDQFLKERDDRMNQKNNPTGLGFLITMGRRLLRPDMIVLGMLMVGITGWIIGYIIDRIERRLTAGLERGGAAS